MRRQQIRFPSDCHVDQNTLSAPFGSANLLLLCNMHRLLERYEPPAHHTGPPMGRSAHGPDLQSTAVSTWPCLCRCSHKPVTACQAGGALAEQKPQADVLAVCNSWQQHKYAYNGVAKQRADSSFTCIWRHSHRQACCIASDQGVVPGTKFTRGSRQQAGSSAVPCSL